LSVPPSHDAKTGRRLPFATATTASAASTDEAIAVGQLIARIASISGAASRASSAAL
jgi:hypothetical protein